MPITDSHGTRVYYEIHGDGAPLVLVHSSGGNHAAWWQQIAGLRDRHRVVTIDLRGFGLSQSDTETYDVLEFPGDIVAVLDDADLTDAVLVGQSMGAAAVLQAAILRPERVSGVIVSNSVGGIDDAGLTRRVRADRAEAEKIPVLDRLMSAEYQAGQPALTTLFRQVGTFNAATMQGLRNLTNDGPTAADLVASGVPVAFLAAERDAVISPATMAYARDLVAGSVLSVVPEVTHSMYWERADLYNRALDELARDLRATRVAS